jgi:hypothetical protein
MRQIMQRPGTKAALLLAATAALVPGGVLAGTRIRIGTHHVPLNSSAPVVVFGGQPVVPMHPFSISLYTDGRVVTQGPAPTTKSSVSLDLRAVLKLAEAEGFFSMPADLTGTEPNVDNGPKFITINTASGSRTVKLEPNSGNTNFIQLYTTLMAIVTTS